MVAGGVVVAALLAGACARKTQYYGVGDIVEIDLARRHVTIRHDAIAGLNGAATSCLPVAVPDVLSRAAVGIRVRFELRQERGALTLTTMTPLAAGMPGLHDHTPHHGGVVGMVGMRHLEALATPAGRIQVYVTDVWRRPLPLSQVSGAVIVNRPAAPQTLPLAAAAECLEAQGAPLHGREVPVKVALTVGGESVEMSFVLPLAPGAAAAAGAPEHGCVPPAERRSTGRSPRCVLTFAGGVSTLAATPDNATALIATVGSGVSAWRLPAGELVAGFAPPPPMLVPAAEQPHAEAPNAITVHPNGRDAVVALEVRLLRYDIATGRLENEIGAPGGVLRAALFAPDGATLLVTAFYDRAAHLVSAEDGHELRRIPVDREAAGVAFAPGGHVAAIGSETGSITMVDLDGRTPGRQLTGAPGPARALAFAGGHLVAAGDDGVLRMWDDATGTLTYGEPVGTPVDRLAVAPDGRLVASAGLDGVIRIYDAAHPMIIETLQWHRAQVLGLAWAGPTLVSGDVAGEVALWDVTDVRAQP